MTKYQEEMLGLSMTQNEKKHLRKRHIRHLRARGTSDWKIELPKTDYNFIRGLRASRQPATEIEENDIWGQRYKVINRMSV